LVISFFDSRLVNNKGKVRRESMGSVPKNISLSQKRLANVTPTDYNAKKGQNKRVRNFGFLPLVFCFLRKDLAIRC